MHRSFPAFLARRLALLALTLVLVPSLSFVMFTLIQGEHAAPLDLLRELGSYLAAVFLQGDLGDANFRSETFLRTRGALDLVKDGFLVDCYLLGGSIGSAVVAGLLAGRVQATRRHSFAARVVTVLTALALAAPVYFVGLMVLLLFAPGSGSVAQVPFLSAISGYRDPVADPVGFVHHIWLPCVIIGAPSPPRAPACARHSSRGPWTRTSCARREARASPRGG